MVGNPGLAAEQVGGGPPGFVCELELMVDEVRAASGDPRSRGGQMQPRGRTGVAPEMEPTARERGANSARKTCNHMSCIAQFHESKKERENEQKDPMH